MRTNPPQSQNFGIDEYQKPENFSLRQKRGRCLSGIHNRRQINKKIALIVYYTLL